MITNLDIQILCGEALIDPGIVMEDQGFQKLLANQANLEELQEYINENF
jgi:hypothetical protein